MGHGWRKCPYIGKAPQGAQQPAQPVAPGGGGGGPHGMAGLLVSIPNHQQDDHQQQQGASLSAFDRNDHQDAVTMPHVPPTKWIVDTGSTRSNTPYRELLHDYKPVQEKVWVVGGRTMAVAGVGTLHLDIKVAGEEMHRLVVPECLQSKQTKSTFGESARSPVWKPGECLNIDLWGPARVATWQGEEMFLGMKDSSSGFNIVSLIKSKEASEVVPKIIELQKFMERQSGNPTKVIRSDRGREFLNSSLGQYCKEAGIKQEVSVAHSQEQNGIAERFNRTVMEKVRTQLASSGMDNRWWGECLYYSVEQLNNLPSSIHEGCLTPHQSFYGHAPPDISRFRPFGAVAYVLKLPRHEEGAGKLDPVSMQGRLVGMSAMSKAYRVYVPGHGVMESCHVRFQVDTDKNSDDMIAVDVSTQTGHLDSGDAHNDGIIQLVPKDAEQILEEHILVDEAADQLTELPPADTVEMQLRS
ncbi:hypothetical protein CEUSTIGMA_g6329.t1 [Chlamydomonas eustigma]|uniref:Integrase catalytic domain-containing protein n=1 Tax=Chlamydomonas eustigma TaxID=1157962 RepID=A0A250X7Z7_9CHLO|nr:hypothetical protein CEUSTIGMA_g6329.t1 [Chlamydomonas eustigma]|eukprot:GAX78890.1 hypothetical protein CEUSTIGMA_g6329.t1 [Chlamydomonas eustigma]